MSRSKLFFILFYLFSYFLLTAETIIDSVYSDPILDGYIYFSQNNQAYSVNNWMYRMPIGDTDVNPYELDPNSFSRGYFSFELPEIPENYYLDSCYVRLYQYDSSGNSTQYQFPIWEVTGGDTIKCILSHIDYGAELDAADWSKGDVGNQFTYTNNVGTVTESWQDGYRYLDVTSCVLLDYENEGPRSQYRIAFQVDTDWDSLVDFVDFITSNSQAEYARPQLFIHLTDEIAHSEDTLIHSKINLRNFPNPFNPTTTIRFDIKENERGRLTIFNLKGQMIESEEFEAGQHSFQWDGNDCGTGLYFYRLKTDGEDITRKMVMMK